MLEKVGTFIGIAIVAWFFLMLVLVGTWKIVNWIGMVNCG